jgi:hypothetical protein
MRGGQPALRNIDSFGKTGTLSGTNPKGLNNWFIGAAPSENPEIAVVAITVNAAYSSKASRLGRMVMQHYFNVPTESLSEISRPAPRRKYGSVKRSRFGKTKYRKPTTYKPTYKKLSSKKKASAKPKSKSNSK